MFFIRQILIMDSINLSKIAQTKTKFSLKVKSNFKKKLKTFITGSERVKAMCKSTKKRVTQI